MSVQELIEKLNSAKSICEIECFDAEMAAIDYAIEAIKVLQEIASEERFTIRDARELIEAWFELVEAK